MRTSPLASFLARSAAIVALAFVAGAGWSQTAPRPAPEALDALQQTEQARQLEGRRNQKVERITHEDAGSRVDEVRYGGQTQSIVVQPKTANAPEYEIAPPSLSRTRPADNRNGLTDSTGTRFWNLLRF